MSEQPLTYLVAVRALCEFTAKKGDLDLRFTPAPSAQEGIAGHALVAARRSAGYQTEISLSGEFEGLQVRGRADGYDPALQQLEEVKTFRGDFDGIKAQQRLLHWAQLKVYGWLMCQQLGVSEIKLALVYFQIDSQQETALCETHDAASLQGFFEQQCRLFMQWAKQEAAHREARDSALLALRFPHPAFRDGQRELSEAVYRSATGARCLLAQAPTGIGKTVGTLFPLLKAVPGQRLDKIFFLTAKTSGRALALDALALLQRGGPEEADATEHSDTPVAKPAQALMPLRVLELIARDKACEHPELACHGDSCPLAKGFYDRLPAARSAALNVARLDKESLREQALAHQVCPYYLSQELVRWADVVVGDYNYYFDQSALLHALSAANEWRVSLLVDEAHNLVERARQMYSATLDQASLVALRRTAPPVLKKDLDRLQRSWNALYRDQEADYEVHESIPAKFLGALQQAVAGITDYLTDNPTTVDHGLQRFYFDALQFARMAEVFGAHSLFDVTLEAGAGRSAQQTGALLCLRNVLPAPFLAPRFASSHASALFSATLSPWDYYTDMLGLPDNTVCVDVPAPFEAEQLCVRVLRQLSTRFQHRHQSLAPMVEIMAGQMRRQPGNYLAFFSSFDYLQQASALLRQQHPDLTVWEQTRRMDEADRAQFLARFQPDSQGLGFAVLGGLFGEGIDLPGKRLIGAFIATLGLPQVNPVNEQIRQRMGVIFGDGYDYTYLYPGLRKVVQAAGRVIRTRTDEGVIYLMDDRFARPEVLRLLPAWWRVQLLDRLPD